MVFAWAARSWDDRPGGDRRESRPAGIAAGRGAGHVHRPMTDRATRETANHARARATRLERPLPVRIRALPGADAPRADGPPGHPGDDDGAARADPGGGRFGPVPLPAVRG